ncbi:hypothetical protein PsYK624_133530 [Phanerochaete sordida]|uniref:Uncharacterized protein n=1 Tax=Phanerochaete sordida TaxID=48140 RepID=A0A9P3GLV1_9APHY|nr:hypothetical protein PsYK624_133530 [Phanerochaete sordida]
MPTAGFLLPPISVSARNTRNGLGVSAGRSVSMSPAAIWGMLGGLRRIHTHRVSRQRGAIRVAILSGPSESGSGRTKTAQDAACPPRDGASAGTAHEQPRAAHTPSAVHAMGDLTRAPPSTDSAAASGAAPPNTRPHARIRRMRGAAPQCGARTIVPCPAAPSLPRGSSLARIRHPLLQLHGSPGPGERTLRLALAIRLSLFLSMPPSCSLLLAAATPLARQVTRERRPWRRAPARGIAVERDF